MRAGALRIHEHADAALAAGLDDGAGRLAEQRDVALEPLWVVALQVVQAVVLLRDLLALVGDHGQVVVRLARLSQARERGQVAGHAGFHVDGPAAVQGAVDKLVRRVVRERDGVDVPGQHHPRPQAEVRARHHRVAEACNLRVLEATKRAFDGVRDRLLVVRGRLDVHERRGKCNWVGEEI